MWHVHNSASSGGEVGGVWGWCLGGRGDRKGSWFAGSGVKGTRVKRSRRICGIWVLAKGQWGFTYPQLRKAFISMNCAQGQTERGGLTGLPFLKHVHEKDMMVN